MCSVVTNLVTLANRNEPHNVNGDVLGELVRLKETSREDSCIHWRTTASLKANTPRCHLGVISFREVLLEGPRWTKHPKSEERKHERRAKSQEHRFGGGSQRQLVGDAWRNREKAEDALGDGGRERKRSGVVATRKTERGCEFWGEPPGDR